MTDQLPRDRDGAIETLFRLHAGALLQVASLLLGDETAAQDAVLGAYTDVRLRGRYRDSFDALDELWAALVRHSRGRPPAPGVLEHLPRRQREVFVLGWWLGLPPGQIGQVLRMSPRMVDREFREARRALPPDVELGPALESQATAAEFSYDVVDQLHERLSAARSRRRNRAGVAVAITVLVLGALASALWATRPRPYSSPTGRPTFAAVVPVSEFETFDVATGKPRGSVTLAGAQAAASLPRGGWLVSRRAPGCRSILTTVQPDGSTQQLGEPLAVQLAGLVVSPDGRSAAGVALHCPGTQARGIDLIDLRTGRIVGERVPPSGTTTVSGLSWAPDSRRVAYTLGSGVGGRGAGYALLDTRRSGERLPPTAPAAKQVDVDGRTCQVVRSLWLGRTGRFAVFAGCLDRNELLLVQVPPQPAAVQRGTVLATLPGSSLTLGLDAVATADGRHLLVTTDVATYRIDGSHVTRLAELRPSPAW